MTAQTTGNIVSTDSEKHEFMMERVFNAPRELVFKAWSDPELLKRWWGPKGWTLPVCKVDFRPGGVWHYCMQGPDGTEAWGKAIYREIVPPERIVYSDFFSDAEGNVAEGLPQTQSTVTFADHNGRTKVTARAQFASAEDLQTTLDMGMSEGMGETFDRLADYFEEIQ